MSTSVSNTPDAVAFIATVMADYQRPWALCGGWAVDAWLGRETRPHQDLDITLFERDQLDAYHHLRAGGWHLIAHDELTDDINVRDLWDGRPLVLPGHLHATQDLEALHRWVPSGGKPRPGDLYLDVQFNELTGDNWLLNREPAIAVPEGQWLRKSAWGVPTVAAPVVMFYKATAYHENPRFAKRNAMDEGDFRALVPQLSGEDRTWLTGAIAAVRPEHPWLPMLADGGS